LYVNFLQVGLLGAEDKEQLNWLQWIPPDSGRAEIPLKSDNSERYPVGVSLSTATQRRLPVGETVRAFSMPVLFLLASDGLLSSFYAVNLSHTAVQVST
jgi:hypothetical protein